MNTPNTDLTGIVNKSIPALIKKIEDGVCKQRDIERLRERLLKLEARVPVSPFQKRLLRNAAFLERNRANLSVVALEVMRKALAQELVWLTTKPDHKRKASKGKLRIGVSDVELEKVSVVSQTGASITLSWSERRKGFFIVAPPDSETSVVLVGPDGFVLQVR